ncbi:MAG: hypothetical protein IKJ30_02240 [Bacilli bacterium]|nr:hypothetical protein [Bacilli bacterium]
MGYSDLYEESLRLTDLVNEYKESKNYDKLEETLLQLIEVYGSLNYSDEDEYLEEVIDSYKELKDIYVLKRKVPEMLETYRLIIEGYDYIIQRDIHQEDLKQKHIKELKEVYEVLKMLYAKANVKNSIKEDFPNIKEYLD